MGNRKRVAIIGLGPMGRRHLQALRLLPGAQLVAVADASPKALEVDVNGARTYTDVQAMLSEVQPGTVIVATNGPSHRALVLAAIAAGVSGILCEKPMACSIAEAEEMISAAHNAGCALAVNHGRRHVPAYSWLAQQLQTGALGQLRSIQSSWPGIGLGCLATHMIDLWRFLGGEELRSVTGWVDPVRGPNPRGSQFCDPGGMIVAISSSGARYVHEQAEDGAGPGTLVIETTGAQIIIDERSATVTGLARDASVKPGPGRPPKYDAFSLPPDAPLALDIVRLTAEILRELLEGKDLTCAAEHGLRSLEVVVGAHLSHRSGHVPVPLPLAGADAKATWLPIT